MLGNVAVKRNLIFSALSLFNKRSRATGSGVMVMFIRDKPRPALQELK